MSMSMLEVITNTVKYYSNNPRATRPGTNICEYMTEEGYRCALGRWFIDPRFNYVEGDVLEVINRIEHDSDPNLKTLDDLLDPEVRGFSTYFWMDLQYLHDSSRFWQNETTRNSVTEEPNKLTDIGANYATFLKRKYGSET